MNDEGFIGRIIRSFIDSKLTPLIIAGALLLGLFAVLSLPREEEPQIVVPMIDVFVQMPGASPKEVEQRVTYPMEKFLWEIPGVEYIYSTSMPGMSMAIVRFYVGEDEEKSIVKFYNKLYSHLDLIPPGVSFPIIKPRYIDDVPILLLTLWSDHYNAYTLRRVAKQLEEEIKNINDVSLTEVIGGERRQLRVILNTARLKAYHIPISRMVSFIQGANQSLEVGTVSRDNREFLVEVSGFIKDAEELGNIIVGVWNERPVYLKNVATIVDGPEEPDSYLFFGGGPKAEVKAIHAQEGKLYQAVTISVAKRKGKNATIVAEKVLHKVEALKDTLIPSKVNVTVTRNYGETAKEKSNELLKHLFIATISVTILIGLFLGFWASLIVFVAIPTTLALTLFIYYFFGYTLNRVTLFALIFCIGILVDDPIVGVENIIRHLRLPESKGRTIIDVIAEAVHEVGSPLILATFTVIAAILPMAFVRGLMGPYMRPIPVGASVAMLFSMAVAFVITPWTAYHVLERKALSDRKEGEKENTFTHWYRVIMDKMIHFARWRWTFIGFTTLLLMVMVSFFWFKIVKVKMLPFDNKSEFQVIIDMPEGATLEKTAQVTQELGQYLSTVPEVTDYQTYVGIASPFNFNGLVRHYFLRKGPNVADIQVNLLPKGQRKTQSHDIAKRVRPLLTAIAQKQGARIKVAEVPPGPPVLQTLVAEVYGPDYERQIDLAEKVLKVFETTEGVVDVDWYVEDKQPKYLLNVDKEKASLSEISTQEVVSALKVALGGEEVGLAHLPKEREDVPIFLQLPRPERSSIADLKEIGLSSLKGGMTPLSELVKVTEGARERNIYHKNLKPVVYVTGDVAGTAESPVYAIMKLKKAVKALTIPEGYEIKQYSTTLPFLTDRFALKWDGEWHITYEVFRDLGLAFGAVLIIIYILVVGWFRSFSIPLVIMAPIPLSLIGIIPAHALMGAFFTATSMIGFIAGAGIVVRNSIILGDFIELRLRQGMPLDRAVIDAGAIRFRPMLLTAMAVVVGASVILFDPIFQGLAISLMAGEVASTLFSRMVVPILYYLNRRRGLVNKS
ncbi:MAG: efflux RND transporter permease subunit [Pseudomonadota bacterium]